MHQRRATRFRDFRVRRLDRFAEPRHHEMRARFRRELEQRFGRLVPGVHREVERAPVTGRNEPPPSSAGLQRILGPEVNVAPGGMERADLEHHEIEGPEPLADRRDIPS